MNNHLLITITPKEQKKSLKSAIKEIDVELKKRGLSKYQRDRLKIKKEKASKEIESIDDNYVFKVVDKNTPSQKLLFDFNKAVEYPIQDVMQDVINSVYYV